MGWPKDPVQYALAKEKHVLAQRARWERDGARANAASKASAFNKCPEYRAKMSETKKRQYAEDPTIAQRIRKTLTGRPSPATPARIAGLRNHAQRKRDRAQRLRLIQERARRA